MAQTFESMKKYEGTNKTIIKTALDQAVDIVRGNLTDFTHHFQSSNSINQFYEPTENVEWTTGFWTGEIWIAYEHTGENCFKESAEIQVDSFLNRILNKIDVNHHDMGFLYSLSCVAAYKLCGNETGKKAALLAADNLVSRYHEKGQFIQAWGDIDAEDNYRLIIDCLLNLPLLYWATEVTGDTSYAQIAENHIKTAMECVVRPDHSTYHTYFFDPKTGKPTYGVTHQGNRNNSAWARGQAWGIYGVALSYAYLKDPKYLEIFEKITDYFIEHLPEDLIAYWDFDFDTGSEEPRDSSSVSIAVCGMLEMAKYLEPAKAKKYTDAADKMLRALIDHCAVKDRKESNGLLLHGTYARDSKENTCTNRGVDECNTFGDYFYLEALIRMSKDWKLYW